MLTLIKKGLFLCPSLLHFTIRFVQGMPAKRKAKVTATAVKFRRSTRGWPLRKSQQINEAMKRAKATNTVERWSEADRLLTALGDLAPPLLLPAEFAVQVVALKLDIFRPEILLIVGAYAGSHFDSVSAGLERFIMARIICLIGQGRCEDALTLAEPLWSHFADEDVGHWGEIRESWANLAFAQHATQKYETSIALYDRFLANDLTSPVSFVEMGEWRALGQMGEWHSFRGVSLMFIGRVEEAKKALEEARILGYSTSWSKFADIMLSTPSRDQCWRRFKEELDWHRGDEDSFVQFLCSRIFDATNFPNSFDPAWLREMHGNVRKADEDTYDISYPRFSADDIALLIPGDPVTVSTTPKRSKTQRSLLS
jgi:tetratricopeptide (TPR) repeat protein